MDVTGAGDHAVATEVDRHVDEQRIACLWFLRPDYHPTTTEERIRVLEHIERHGDLELTCRRMAAAASGIVLRWT